MKVDKHKHRLFVYGTLMLGERHHDALSDARFVGPAHTRAEFDLVQIDYYPAMVPGGKLRIHGEVYEISDATLAKVDRVEGHPGDFVRQSITLDDGREVLAYLMPAARVRDAQPIASGYFRLRTAPPKKGPVGEE